MNEETNQLFVLDKNSNSTITKKFPLKFTEIVKLKISHFEEQNTTVYVDVLTSHCIYTYTYQMDEFKLYPKEINCIALKNLVISKFDSIMKTHMYRSSPDKNNLYVLTDKNFMVFQVRGKSFTIKYNAQKHEFIQKLMKFVDFSTVIIDKRVYILFVDHSQLSIYEHKQELSILSLKHSFSYFAMGHTVNIKQIRAFGYERISRGGPVHHQIDVVLISDGPYNIFTQIIGLNQQYTDFRNQILKTPDAYDTVQGWITRGYIGIQFVNRINKTNLAGFYKKLVTDLNVESPRIYSFDRYTSNIIDSIQMSTDQKHKIYFMNCPEYNEQLVAFQKGLSLGVIYKLGSLKIKVNNLRKVSSLQFVQYHENSQGNGTLEQQNQVLVTNGSEFRNEDNQAEQLCAKQDEIGCYKELLVIPFFRRTEQVKFALSGEYLIILMISYGLINIFILYYLAIKCCSRKKLGSKAAKVIYGDSDNIILEENHKIKIIQDKIKTEQLIRRRTSTLQQDFLANGLFEQPQDSRASGNKKNVSILDAEGKNEHFKSLIRSSTINRKNTSELYLKLMIEEFKSNEKPKQNE